MAVMRALSFPGVLALLALGLMAGCGGSLGSVTASLGRVQQADLNTVSRDKLVAFGQPIMRVTIPGLGIDTLVSPRETKGDLVTWEAADGYTFTFRNGVLIETRGLGPDLMSAAAPAASQIAAGAATNRSYFYAWDSDANQRRDYRCIAEQRGQETVAIYGRNHTARHVVEACQRDVGRLSNEFWFEAGSIRQSKQWISPEAGPGFFYRVVD